MPMLKAVCRTDWKKNQNQGNWSLVITKQVIIQTYISKISKNTKAWENILISLSTIPCFRNDESSDKRR